MEKKIEPKYSFIDRETIITLCFQVYCVHLEIYNSFFTKINGTVYLEDFEKLKTLVS